MNEDLNKISPYEIARLLVIDEVFKWTIATNMTKYGGSFVKILGDLLFHADDDNTLKIGETWMEYVLQYQPSKWPEPDHA